MGAVRNAAPAGVRMSLARIRREVVCAGDLHTATRVAFAWAALGFDADAVRAWRHADVVNPEVAADLRDVHVLPELLARRPRLADGSSLGQLVSTGQRSPRDVAAVATMRAEIDRQVRRVAAVGGAIACSIESTMQRGASCALRRAGRGLATASVSAASRACTSSC